MSGDVRIVFVEDHPFFRDGLRKALSAAHGLDVVGEASDGATALELITSLRPDVSILDITLPVMDGVTVVRRLRERRVPTEVIFLTVHDDEDMLEEALDIGVKGYLLKDCTQQELLRCVSAVAAGQHYATPPMTGYLVEKAQRIERFVQRVPGLTLLTALERAILLRIAQHKSSKEIGQELGIAPKTVDAHRSSICKKLKIQGTHGLSRFAVLHRSDI